MFNNSIILTNYFQTNPNPATLSPAGFKPFIAASNPNWMEHFKGKMLSLGFSPIHWDAADWEPAMWSNDNAMHSKNPTSCALLAVGGYLFRSAVQITRYRPFVDTPVTSEQLSTIHPSIKSESIMLISFSQKMWQEKQAGYFVVAEQEHADGAWLHEPAFYVDTPYAVMLMCKYNAMQQAKQNGNMQRFEELLYYPRKKAPKVAVKAVAEKKHSQELYQQWLSHCAELKARKAEIEKQILEHREAIKSLQEQYEQIKAPRFK